ncbi:unnamed protein product [Protopolystoma xenopodis]|uniref:Uncharacterized protein n=1 Tax=Protopolystoma xenopodis TaxID=117903 RepID=A0A448WFU1_9PLAT|nr:unnamed protein product [Protopolystoma xenopodis]
MLPARRLRILTGECSKPASALTSPTLDEPTGTLSASTAISSNIAERNSRQASCANYAKVTGFSKMMKKFIFSCLQLMPNKRGTLDFWLDTRLFSLNKDYVQQLSTNVISATPLRQYLADNPPASWSLGEGKDDIHQLAFP